MTKIKLCGLKRPCDIETANELGPDFIGFVFAPASKRYVTPEQAAALRQDLRRDITAVGVFVNEKPETVAALLDRGIIEMAQLHGDEDEAYIERLRRLTGRPIIKAFRMKSEREAVAAAHSSADFVLLDSGAGTGKAFDWNLSHKVGRPYFMAGGLEPGNAAEAVRMFHPYAVDVSSGIETDGYKDSEKMRRFVKIVREIE